jgi:uncharacterized membrane protein
MAIKQALNLANALLKKLSTGWITAFTLLCIAVIGITDYLIGPGLSLGILYLAPTALATWYITLVRDKGRYQRIGAVIATGKRGLLGARQ